VLLASDRKMPAEILRCAQDEEAIQNPATIDQPSTPG
jgi:hypothetical protein